MQWNPKISDDFRLSEQIFPETAIDGNKSDLLRMKGILGDVKNFSKCGTSREKIWFKLDSSQMQLTSEQLPVGLIDQFTC